MSAKPDELSDRIARKQAEVDAAEENLGDPANTLDGALRTKLNKVAALQRELAELKALRR